MEKVCTIRNVHYSEITEKGMHFLYHGTLTCNHGKALRIRPSSIGKTRPQSGLSTQFGLSPQSIWTLEICEFNSDSIGKTRPQSPRQTAIDPQGNGTRAYRQLLHSASNSTSVHHLTLVASTPPLALRVQYMALIWLSAFIVWL